VLDEAALAHALDPVQCARAAAGGGGPAPSAVRAQLDALAADPIAPRLDAWSHALERADATLSSFVERAAPERAAPKPRGLTPAHARGLP
jgi:hypothetical protein